VSRRRASAATLLLALAAAILPDSWDGRFPSDHLPVLADVVACR
jgi:hypothetical protein